MLFYQKQQKSKLCKNNSISVAPLEVDSDDELNLKMSKQESRRLVPGIAPRSKQIKKSEKGSKPRLIEDSVAKNVDF